MSPIEHNGGVLIIPPVVFKYETVYPQIGLILVHLVVFVVHCIT